MVAPRSYPRPTHAEQAELAARAKAGDRDAYDRLAEAVWGWCRRQAGRYSRRFGVDADTLESIGLARLPLVVKCFDKGKGSFLNIFASAAARAMLAEVRKVAARRKREVPSTECVDAEPAREGETHPADAAVLAALAKVEPVGRELVRLVEVERVPLRKAAARLGLTDQRAELLHRRAFNALSDMLTDVRPD